jgi:hypothetical protein
MKIVIVLLLLVFFAPGIRAQNILTDTDLKFAQLHWLTGQWERVGMYDPRKGIEKWKRESDSVYTGKGLLLSGSDTLFAEQLGIVIKDDLLYYVADVPENPEPVYFELVQVGNNYFISRNSAHDFPQKISYRLENGELRVIVSNDKKQVEYRFRKKK